MAEEQGTRRTKDATDEELWVDRAVARALERQLPALVARLAERTSGGTTGESAAEEGERKDTPTQFLSSGMTSVVRGSITLISRAGWMRTNRQTRLSSVSTGKRTWARSVRD